MSGNRLLVDTNILLYFLKGDQEIIEILSDKELVISFITELELLSFPKISDNSEKIIKEFLKECLILDINPKIKYNVIKYRKLWKLKLPDAIIAATALHYKLPLFTADKAFSNASKLNVIMYEV